MSDMPPKEFRKAGHEVVDWIADYLEGVRDYPVLSRIQPGDLLKVLPAAAPDSPELFEDILEDFRNLVVPGVTHWNHPRFHAYFSVSASAPGILAEMLIAALNVNGMLWKSCPSATELEQVTMKWLAQWMGLPDDYFGIIYDTASISTMHALACAREWKDPEARTRGSLPNLTVYTSEQAHSSVEKGAIAIGIGQDNVRKIAVDENYAMRIDKLKAAVASDLEAGKTPCCFVPSVGTTGTSSIDPVDHVIDIAEQHGAWVHIDASYAGSAAIVPECQHILSGAARAHSLVVNPHKWLFTPIDLSAFYTRRPDILRRAFSLVPEYLRTAEDPHAINFMDYGVPLGRRFRALKLWFVMRYFGRDRCVEILRNHLAWTRDLARQIAAHPRFELAAPVPFSLICFRLKASDEANRELMDRVNASGVCFLSHTLLDGRFVLRLAVGNIKVTREDLDVSWTAIQEIAETL